MKRNTDSLPKFKGLMRELGLPRYATMGVLEAVWDLTGKHAPRGNLGKFSNQEIADDLGWDGDADKLVEALVKHRWLDTCETHRLLVHDWKDHAPDWLKKVVVRANQGWAADDSVRQWLPVADSGGQRQPVAASGCLPDQTRPSQTNPDQTKPQDGGGADGPIDGDPWGKPKAVYADPPAPVSADPSEVGAVKAALEGFGFNPSNAYNHAKKPGATLARVRWLLDTARQRLEENRIGKEKAMAFVVAGIRDKLDPDPGPEVEDKSAKLRKALEENARKRGLVDEVEAA